MKLFDELQQIEKSKTIANWPDTLSKLADLMRDRANNASCGAVLIAVHSWKIEINLEAWAIDQGLVVNSSRTGFGTPALWLEWGNPPDMIEGCDAEIMADGSLIIYKKSNSKENNENH